jgi:tetratricopeptide (TPR) repeat protein
MIRAAFMLVLLLTAADAHAQTAQEWVTRGHEAARANRHADAIAAYERAIAADAALRADLLASLGRQYLWSDRPARAAELLAEYLTTRSDCDVRSDYGLALSWSDRLREARDVLTRTIADCPAAAGVARLRLAQVYRWLGRPARAAMLYTQALADSSAVRDAQLGLAWVAFDQEYNRAAVRAFHALHARRVWNAAEGEALAFARLGEYGEAMSLLQALRARAPLSRDMLELQERTAALDGVQVSSTVRTLRDADASQLWSYELTATRGWNRRGRGGLSIRESQLSFADSDLHATQAAALAEYRWSPAFAARGELGVQYVRTTEWSPVTGELHAILTPNDVMRGDLSVTRLLVTDHTGAMRDRLVGNMIAAGADLRVTPTMTVAAATDVTLWSTDNRRVRLRGVARWRPEGTVALTVELPLLVQLYDEPMPFPFFSPDYYIEAGPGANIDVSLSDAWRVSLYARAGAQRESNRPWDPFGTARAAVWRELIDRWALRARVGWSDSNVASSTSFRRTSIELSLVREF